MQFTLCQCLFLLGLRKVEAIRKELAGVPTSPCLCPYALPLPCSDWQMCTADCFCSKQMSAPQPGIRSINLITIKSRTARYPDILYLLETLFPKLNLRLLDNTSKLKKKKNCSSINLNGIQRKETDKSRMQFVTLDNFLGFALSRVQNKKKEDSERRDHSRVRDLRNITTKSIYVT